MNLPQTTRSIGNVLLSVALGIGVTWWLFSDEFSTFSLSEFSWNGRMLAGFALALLFVCGRDFGLAWRFHTIAHPTLSWPRAVRTDLMCAFTSAITPSAMGGSAFAIFYLNSEGVELGKATTMTLTTLFLDELFFVIFCPIILFIVPLDSLFASTGHAAFMEGVKITFWLVYAGIVVWTAILFMGIILWPTGVSRAIKCLFALRLLRRWRRGAHRTANNMVDASRQLRHCTARWWANVFGATVLSWFSRYFVVNALFWGFVPEASWLLVFARQFVVWVLLMIAPTPGGSGVSEWLFTEYYGDLMHNPQVTLILAVTWRILSYYIYLLIGCTLLPHYIKTFRKSKQLQTQ